MLGQPGKVISSWSLQHSHASSSWLGTIWWNSGEGAGRCLLGLKHNVHIHYLEVNDDAPQQLVMFVQRFRSICSNWRFWCGCQQMYRQTAMLLVHMHSGFPTRRSKETIVMSWNDVTGMSHAILGGNYKRRAHWNLEVVISVFWYWMFGSTNKSQTLYSGYLSASCGAEHNQNGLCVLFIHIHVPRPFWGTFSQCDFSCLTLAG